MTTALEVPANWYPDPTGRAHARYWDGRMWTAHVVRDGVTTLDPIDGIQQPRGPGPFSRGVTPTAHVPEVGHGTRALQEMAATRPTRRLRSIPTTSEPRISTRGAVGVFLFALLLFLIGVFLYRQGALTVNTAPPTISPSVTLDQPEYHVTLPNAWAHRAATGSLFDAEYSVPDKETVSVAVVDFTDASLADATVRDAHLAMASDMVAGWIGDHPALVARSRVKVGDKTLVVATYDITAASGVVTRVAEYVAIAPDRAVIVTAYGPQDAVGHHLGAVAAAASTAKVTLPREPASTPGPSGGTDATRSPT